MSSEKPLVDPAEVFIQKSKNRFFRILDYLTLFLYVVVVSIAALFADYILIQAIQLTIASDILRYPIVAQVFDWFKIGSAFLVIIGAAIHAFFSAWSQVRFEIETSRESVSDS